MENFRRFSRIFSEFSAIFLEFSAIFLENFYNFFGKFLQFSAIFPKIFSENSRSQSVTVQPGSRHYCKFTSKFTSKFTPILIKILQSTKFEGSHFFNFLSTFTDTNRISKLSYLLSPLCAPFPSPPRFPNHSSAVPKVPMAVPPLAMAEVCGQYEGL